MRRCLAWRDGADSTPCLPKKEPYALSEFLLPSLGPLLASQLPVTERWAQLHGSSRSQDVGQSSAPARVCCSRVTSFLVPASCQLERVLPRFVSDWRGFLSSTGEGCQEEVWGACSSLQGCDPVFLNQKPMLKFRAIISTSPALLPL